MIRILFVKINVWSKQFLKFLRLQDEYQVMIICLRYNLKNAMIVKIKMFEYNLTIEICKCQWDTFKNICYTNQTTQF